MTVFFIIGSVALGGLLAFFLIFIIFNLFEKEKRALARCVLFFLTICCLSLTFIFFLPDLRNFYLGGFGILFLVFLVVMLFFPVSKNAPLISGEQKKIDERDVIFARFDLEEGTPSYNEYYSRKPEYEKNDRESRRFPDILSDEHIKKDPHLQSLAAAEFDFLERLLPFVDGDVHPRKQKDSAERNTQRIKKILKYFSSVQTGICSLDPAYVYSHVGRGPDKRGQKINTFHRYAIVFAIEMKFEMIASAPRSSVIVETGRRYVEAAKTGVILAEYIRRMGYSARAHIAGSNYQTMLVPLAWKAGLGELGRLGVLISPKYGPRVRLGCVTTDMSLVSDSPVDFGVQDFCRSCQKCASNCPAHAIPSGEKTEENGIRKWVLQREICYRFWRKAGTDCAICLYVCPYSKPRNPFHDFIRLLISHSRLSQRISILGDDLFYGRRPISKKEPL